MGVFVCTECPWGITPVCFIFSILGKWLQIKCLYGIFSKLRDTRLVLIMMTSSNGNLFRVTGPLCGEFIGPGAFPAQRPVTRSFDVSFDLRLNKRLSKQPWGWWFEMISSSLWRHCNALYCPVFSDLCFVWPNRKHYHIYFLLLATLNIIGLHMSWCNTIYTYTIKCLYEFIEKLVACNLGVPWPLRA